MAKKRSFFKSLRGKISLQMLLVSLIPIVIIGAVAYTSMSSAEDKTNNSVDNSRVTLENNTVGKTKSRLAWLLSLELETWVAERIAEVKSWSGNPDIRDAATNSSDEGRAAWAVLAEKTSGSPFFDDAYVTNASGKRIAQFGLTSNEVEDDSGNPLWQTAMEKGLCVSDISLDRTELQPSFHIAIAFRLNDFTTRETLGVVVGQIALQPTTLRQEYASKLPDDRLVIWSRTGQLIVDSESMERFLEDTPTWTESEQQVMSKMAVDTPIIQPDYVITDEAVAGYARAANESVSMQFPEFEGLRWMVMVEEPSKTALAALDSLEDLKGDLADNTDRTLITLIAIVLGVVVIVPGVAFYLSRGITRPVARLRDTAEKVSLGDTEVEVEVESNDEIGDLAESFGRMVAAIRFLSKDGEE